MAPDASHRLSETLSEIDPRRPAHCVLHPLGTGQQARYFALARAFPFRVLLDIERMTYGFSHELDDFAHADVGAGTQLQGAADRLGGRERGRYPAAVSST